MLGVLAFGPSCVCSMQMPSPACRAAAQTENIIKCLSLNGNFKDTLHQADFCEQTRTVYTCFNRTCCLENRAFDISRDSSIATCNIDCSHTSMPPPTTSTTPSEVYTSTMAAFTTPSPANPIAAPWDKPVKFHQPTPPPGTPLATLPPHHWDLASKTEHGDGNHLQEQFTIGLTMALLPVSALALFPLWTTFQQIQMHSAHAPFKTKAFYGNQRSRPLSLF